MTTLNLDKPLLLTYDLNKSLNCLNIFIRRCNNLADEETNKLVDEVEEKETKENASEAQAEAEVTEVQAEPEPVADEVANPPVEDVSEAASINEVMALVKQLQAQVDALSTIQPDPEPETAPEPETPQETPEEPKQDDPDDIEKLLDL